jgi:iron complex transport system substrate-binding protein
MSSGYHQALPIMHSVKSAPALCSQLLLVLLVTLLAMQSATAAQRVITLSPHATELVYFAGGQGRLVGVSNFSDFPPEVSSLPRIGDATGIDRESILLLQPDLAVVWSGGRSSDLQWLREQQIQVFESDPQNLQAIADEILALGKLLGTADHAERSHAALTRRLQQLRSLAPRSAPEIRTIHLVWQRPLMLLTDAELVSQALALCGITNPLHLPGHKLATVTREYLWNIDADAIVIDDQGFIDLPQHGDVVIRADTRRLHRPSPRLLDAAVELCREIIRHTADRPGAAAGD